MEWNEKTPKQYEAYLTLVMGGENNNEVYLDETQFGILWNGLHCLVAWIDGEDRPFEGRGDTWESHKEGLRTDIKEMRELLDSLNCVDDYEDDTPTTVLELDEIRLKRGLISPVDFIEQKKRQFINEGIQELITDD